MKRRGKSGLAREAQRQRRWQKELRRRWRKGKARRARLSKAAQVWWNEEQARWARAAKIRDIDLHRKIGFYGQRSLR